jgi:hypothetical protein
LLFVEVALSSVVSLVVQIIDLAYDTK